MSRELEIIGYTEARTFHEIDSHGGFHLNLRQDDMSRSSLPFTHRRFRSIVHAITTDAQQRHMSLLELRCAWTPNQPPKPLAAVDEDDRLYFAFAPEGFTFDVDGERIYPRAGAIVSCSPKVHVNAPVSAAPPGEGMRRTTIIARATHLPR